MGRTYDAAGNRTSKTAVQQASPNPVSVTSKQINRPFVFIEIAGCTFIF